MPFPLSILLLNKRVLFITLFFFYFGVSLFSQSLGTQQKILEDFELIESQNRFLNSFGDLGADATADQAYNLPIGLKKIAGNIEFTLAVTRIRFDQKLGSLTLLMKMYVPQKNKVLIFGADNIGISFTGDLVGNIQLYLLNDIPIPMGNAGDFIIKGGYDEKTGNISSDTYVTLDCNGEFVELSLDGEIALNKNTFKAVAGHSPVGSAPLAGDSIVRAQIRTVVRDWNDIFAEVQLPPFEIKGAKDLTFSLSKATLDLSDYRSPQNFSPDAAYLNEYYPLGNLNLWRGLYIEHFRVTFPPHFKKKGTEERITIDADRMLIDENGVTGLIGAKNILPFEQGDASGWSFSVSDFKLELIANRIKGFGFGGQVGIPVSAKQQVLDYSAFISKDEYLIRANISDSMKIDMFGDATLKLEKTSYMEMKVRDKRFVPRIVLDGRMDLNIEGLEGDAITFSKLSIGADAPVISVEAMGYGGEIKLNNFPLTISDIRLATKNKEISLALDAKVNLMKDKLAAGTRLTLLSEYRDNKFNFKGLNINAIILDGAQMSGFTLNGELRMEKNHPVYGKYFGGSIKATFKALSDDLTVGVTAVFGNKDYRYWYVEGNANFGNKGVPVGPFTINGFTGGVYYKMSPTGGSGLQAYAPNDKTSLGLKAGISFFIAQEKTANGNALFETNFSSSGGINSMKFYGMARFMASLDLAGIGGDKLTNLYKKAQEKLGDNLSDSFSAKISKGKNGSELAKSILPDVPGLEVNAGINAYLSMNFDFPTKTFDADFRLMVNVPGGFLKGTGNNNEAGWVKLHLSPQDWYVHAGTPTNPIGLKLGLGPLSLSTKSYFMLGDKLEKSALPPQAVLDILGMTAVQADYMKYPQQVSIGKGVAFGSRFEFDTGDLTFLILYARFMAGTGFDIMLADMSDYACEGSSSPIGMDGWYANGQCYAYLSGEMGVKIKLFFIKKRITILKGATAALLQARIPNPTWIGGSLAVKLNVLGLIKLNMKMKMSFGNDCKLVRLDGDYSPLDFPIISDLSPKAGEDGVDVFFSPQGTFSVGIDKPFEVEDEEGNPQTYRVTMEDFFIKDAKGQKLIGDVKWAGDKQSAVFESFEILPPYSDLTVEVSVNFEEWKNGRWQAVTSGGQKARESKTVRFKTGEAPNYIPRTNIDYCYPVVGQNNFFRTETDLGYVQLKRGQDYLFPKSFKYNTKFTDAANEKNSLISDFNYNTGERRIGFTLPETANKTKYSIEFVAMPEAGSKASETPQEAITTKTIKDAEGEEMKVDYTQQAAQQIIRDGQMVILDYTIRTSAFNTFAEKLSSFKLSTDFSRAVTSNTRSFMLRIPEGYELFDEPELTGSDYTGGKPLVETEAILDDEYYIEDIAPLMYNWQPIKGISITDRDMSTGIPPVKYSPLYDGYLEYVLDGNTYNGALSVMFPYVYEQPYRYSLDYYSLRNKAANILIKNIERNAILSANEKTALERLVESIFPFIRQGYYKTEFRYILPGGKKGSSKQLDYYNSLDWRK